MLRRAFSFLLIVTLFGCGVELQPLPPESNGSQGNSNTTAPTAEFTYSTNIDGFTVSVDASQSSDADNDALTYRWDFNGEATKTGKNAQYTFRSAGPKNIKLIVNDGTVDSAPVTKQLILVAVEESNTPPTVSFTLITSDLSVHVDGSASTDPDGDTLTYVWIFDGDIQPESTSPVADYTFTTAGEKIITLRINDGKAQAAAFNRVKLTAPGVDYSAELSAISSAMPGANCLFCHGSPPQLGAEISYGSGSGADIEEGIKAYLTQYPDKVATVRGKPTGVIMPHTGQKPFASEPLKTQWETLVDGIAQSLTSGGGSNANTGNGTVLISEDYETQTVGENPAGWGINHHYNEYEGADAAQFSDVIQVQSNIVHSGSKALRVTGIDHSGSKRYIYQDLELPDGKERLFVRFYVYSSEYMGNRATNPNGSEPNHNHFMALTNGDVYNEKEIRIGEMKGALGINDSVSDGLVPKDGYWHGKTATPRMEAQQWYCVETAFLNDSDQPGINIWLDDVLLSSSGPSDFHSYLPNDWMNGRFKRIDFGWASWGTYDNDVYFDDIVVSTERIGCM